ncbi:hypothetical protein P9112_014361 [Eukaryota sp. TZLM1-RC]
MPTEQDRDHLLSIVVPKLSVVDIVRFYKVSHRFQHQINNILNTLRHCNIKVPHSHLSSHILHFLTHHCPHLQTLHLHSSLHKILPTINDSEALLPENQANLETATLERRALPFFNMITPSLSNIAGHPIDVQSILNELGPGSRETSMNHIVSYEAIIDEEEYTVFQDISAQMPLLGRLDLSGGVVNEEFCFSQVCITISSCPLVSLLVHQPLNDGCISSLCQTLQALSPTLRHLKLLSFHPLRVNNHVPVAVARQLKTLITNRICLSLLSELLSIESLSVTEIPVILTESLMKTSVKLLRGAFEVETITEMLINLNTFYFKFDELSLFSPLKYIPSQIWFKNQHLLQNFLSKNYHLCSLSLVDLCSDDLLKSLPSSTCHLRELVISFSYHSKSGNNYVTRNGISFVFQLPKLRSLCLSGLNLGLGEELVYTPSDISIMKLLNCSFAFNFMKAISMTLPNLTYLEFINCYKEELDRESINHILTARMLKYLIMENVVLAKYVDVHSLRSILHSLPCITHVHVDEYMEEEEEDEMEGYGISFDVF